MRLAKDYKGIVTLLEEGSIDIALLGGVSYTIAKSKAELIPLVKPLNPRVNPFIKVSLSPGRIRILRASLT